MKQEYIEPETSNVIGVQFSIMGPEEIRKRSVVDITKHETYDRDAAVIRGMWTRNRLWLWCETTRQIKIRGNGWNNSNME